MSNGITRFVAVLIGITLYYQGYTWTSYGVINALANMYGPYYFQTDTFEMFRGTGMFIQTWLVVFLSMYLVMLFYRRRDDYLPISYTLFGAGYFFYRPMSQNDETIFYALTILFTNVQTFIVFCALLVTPVMTYWILVKFVFKLPVSPTSIPLFRDNTDDSW